MDIKNMQLFSISFFIFGRKFLMKLHISSSYVSDYGFQEDLLRQSFLFILVLFMKISIHLMSTKPIQYNRKMEAFCEELKKKILLVKCYKRETKKRIGRRNLFPFIFS